MTTRVRLFARARDLAGAEALSVELPPGATVADLRRALGKEVPALAGLLERSAVGVNEEYAADETIIPAGAEVAIIPPVSGGGDCGFGIANCGLEKTRQRSLRDMANNSQSQIHNPQSS